MSFKHRYLEVGQLIHGTGCHRTVGMVFRYRLRGLLLLLLNSSNNFYHSDTGFREATEVCESFYDTLTWEVVGKTSDS